MQELLQPQRRERVLYIQIPDSDPAGVVSTAHDLMENFGVSAPRPHDPRSLAVCIGELCAQGWIVALDEFQTFSRKALFPLTSELQSELHRLAARPAIKGGLIVLGSLHTEMQALLEERSDTEIDLVALAEGAQRLRLGSCKRSAAALVADLGRFDGDVARFLHAFPRFSPWQAEKVAIAPSLNQEARQAILAMGYLPQSLDELTAGLL